jgi:hypothetical protein
MMDHFQPSLNPVDVTDIIQIVQSIAYTMNPAGLSSGLQRDALLTPTLGVKNEI